MQSIRYHDLDFQPDMLTARRADGSSIRFSRQERALLMRLSRQPGVLVSRAQLLDGLGDDAGALSERHVDYLVNRLRKRLGDNARTPRFIGTQYGEGYVWIAEAVVSAPVKALLVVGPVFGRDGSERGMKAIERLAALLSDKIDRADGVVFRPDWRHEPGSADEIGFFVEASVHEEAGKLHVALALREGKALQPVEAFRLLLAEGEERAGMETAADRVRMAIWNYHAMPDAGPDLPADRPVHLRMHDAATLMTADPTSWRESEARLLEALEADPDNPRLAVMLALNRFTRLVQNLAEIYQTGADSLDWQALETEMEALVLRALPAVRDDPMQLLAIAKVLHFIDRGHLDLAEQLANEAFLASTAFAASFAMKGLIAASRGRIDEALELYDKSIELTEAGSHFHIYLLVLKATALLADNRRAALEEVAVELFHHDPRTRVSLGLLLVSPDAEKLPPRLDQMLNQLPAETGKGLLMHLHRVSARHFQRRSHRRNVLYGLASHLIRRHGPQVLPEALVPLLGTPKRAS